MTTTLIAPQQTQEAPQQVRETPQVHETPPKQRRPRTAVWVVALVVLAAALAGLGYVLQQYVSGTSAATGTEWTYAYGMGSTVYAEQVPAEAAAFQSIMEGYGPLSTVYDEQVPSAPWWASYGPTSSLFHEQVPTS